MSKQLRLLFTLRWSNKIFFFATILWLLGSVCWSVFINSPQGKSFWSYNSDGKGGGVENTKEAWACPVRNGGYHSCTPQEGLESALFFAPVRILIGFFLPFIVASEYPGRDFRLADLSALLYFPPLGIFLIYALAQFCLNGLELTQKKSL